MGQRTRYPPKSHRRFLGNCNLGLRHAGFLARRAVASADRFCAHLFSSRNRTFLCCFNHTGALVRGDAKLSRCVGERFWGRFWDATGHWPVPPGDSPGGTRSAPGVSKDGPLGCSRLAFPVGESPTAMGESPVLPILRTRSKRIAGFFIAQIYRNPAAEFAVIDIGPMP